MVSEREGGKERELERETDTGETRTAKKNAQSYIIERILRISKNHLVFSKRGETW